MSEVSLKFGKKFKGTSVQVHCVHPGHVGTNIIDNSRFNIDDERFMNQQIDKDKMAERFRTGGMHPSRAAEIILKELNRIKDVYLLV